MHIYELELLALKLALKPLLKAHEIESMHIQMSNIVALTYFLKMGATKIYKWFAFPNKFGSCY